MKTKTMNGYARNSQRYLLAVLSNNKKDKSTYCIKKEEDGQNTKENIKKETRKMSENKKQKLNKMSRTSGITLIALMVTILFSYDEKLECSNNKGFLLQTI